MPSPDITRGPIGPTLVTLAWPVIAGEALHTAFHLVDIAWVGPLGAWATGAIMTSMFTLWIALALMNLVGVGLTAHVSRAIGSGRRERAGAVVAQALWLAMMLGLIVAAAGWSFSHALFRQLVEDEQVAQAGGDYLRIVSLGLPLTFVYGTAASAMRACGNTRMPLALGGLAVLANIALAPVFIYGIGPVPALGVAGSAIATVLCQAGAAAGFLVVALRRHPDLPIDTVSLRRPDMHEIASLARIGAPYFGVGALFSLVYLWYAHVASAFGAAALAILGIGNRLESITYLSADGFAVAASTFVGQNLGAKNPARAERGAWHAAGLMSAAAVVVGLAMFAFPLPLVGLFTRDPEVLLLAVPWMRVLALCQVFTALEGVIGGGFAGAGDTMPPMIVHVAVAIARVPLASAAAFGLGLGPMGIAWTMTLTCIVRACILAWWFRRGRWKSMELPGEKARLPAPEAVDAGVDV